MSKRSTGPGQTLFDAGISDGDTVTLLRVAWIPPKLPPQFTVNLESHRRALGWTGFSSGFTIIYKFNVDVPGNKITVEFWRKNDHDKIEYDFETRIMKSKRGHWYSGSKHYEEPLDVRGALADLVAATLETPAPVPPGEFSFWRVRGSVVTESDPVNGLWGDAPANADRRPVPRKGWFEKPDDECTELEFDLPILGQGRALIDSNGMPLRVAVITNHPMPTHDVVEEYDVEFSFSPAKDSPEGKS